MQHYPSVCTVRESRKWSWRFWIAVLLLVGSPIGGACYRYHRTCQAARAIVDLGGSACFFYTKSFVWEFVSDDFVVLFAEPHVIFIDVQLTRLELERLRDSLAVLGTVKVFGVVGTTVNDDWLKHLEGSQVRFVILENTSVTDAGLMHLQAWGPLEQVKLRDNKSITAAGVRRLELALPGVDVDSNL